MKKYPIEKEYTIKVKIGSERQEENRDSIFNAIAYAIDSSFCNRHKNNEILKREEKKKKK